MKISQLLFVCSVLSLLGPNFGQALSLSTAQAIIQGQRAQAIVDALKKSGVLEHSSILVVNSLSCDENIQILNTEVDSNGETLTTASCSYLNSAGETLQLENSSSLEVVNALMQIHGIVKASDSGYSLHLNSIACTLGSHRSADRCYID